LAAIMWVLKSEDAGLGGPYVFRVTAERARTLGRGPQADFIIDSPLISRVHCRLVVINKELVVENLGSTNGIFINGRQVERSTLHAGDRLRTGRIEFTISTD